jgi:cell division protein FtsB
MAHARAARRGGIRWDRVARVALVVTLGAIVLLYVSPVARWISQSHEASREHRKLRELTRQHQELERRVSELQTPGALEREARRLGMVRRGERAYVIENLPR